MDITKKQITVRELIEGYEEKGAEGIEGVVAYSGKLDVRPAYQREYVYSGKDRDEVIHSVEKGFPINVMYWSKVGDDHYELMDGQQRTISICRYAAESERTFAVDYKYFFNLTADEQEAILNYPLDIYICDGTPSEVLAWFQVINIAGVKLSDQELRNTSYTGTWLSDAKIHLSKPNCAAYNMAKDYVSGSPIRQEYLEAAIRWVADRDGIVGDDPIKEYMALHQHDENANPLWIYFRRVIEWVQIIFPVKRKEMKGIEWGLLYNKFKDAELDPDKLEQEIKQLMMDDDVTNNKGIYTYVLTRDERHLNIRAFTESMKRQAYERQNGICPFCQAKGNAKIHYELKEMHADHITPWHLGGKTIAENCQMLCADCNRHKSGK
ncbi:HNH endonuclease family protein [Ligaoa zhengdingensis]|uniref:HNH endonuclease family protein n=1 Tax=Ligaoa zhengdingensis TaxID=2763658 RepID=UPI0031B9DA8A